MRELTDYLASLYFSERVLTHSFTPQSYATQLFIGLLPELFLISVIAITLILLAVDLGRDLSKKETALNSLNSLKLGLTAMLSMYLYSLVFFDNGVLLNGYVVLSPYVTAMKALTVFAGRFVLSASEAGIRASERDLIEYPLILVLALCFMTLLIGSEHLFAAFLTIVGFSLNLYVLILFNASSAAAREAGIKYFYLSTISSGLILYGVILTFFSLNTGSFHEINQILSTDYSTRLATENVLQLALIFLLVGLFFKLAAFPGHLGASDVYEGSPDPVTGFFMLPVKIAVLAFVVQLLITAFGPVIALGQPIIVASAVGSLVGGCVAALAEKKTKRFLAYTSINQMGFLLIGVASGSIEGVRATIFYLFFYVIMNIGFLLIFLNTFGPSWKPVTLHYLTDFTGFGQDKRASAYIFILVLVILSMAGIPPLAGFFGKYFLLLHAQQQGLYVLVITGLATSLLSAYYYLRLIKLMLFEKSTARIVPVLEAPSDLSYLTFVELMLGAVIPCGALLLVVADAIAMPLYAL